MATRQQKKGARASKGKAAPVRRREVDPADQRVPVPDGAWARSQKLCRFIVDLGQHGNVTRAIAAAKVNRAYVYDRRVTDQDFADAWTAALKQGLEVLKDEAWRRAHEGVLEPKGIAGRKVMVRKYSDTLLMFLIKQADPTFREHFDVNLGNAGGRPFMFQMALHPEAVKQAQGDGK